MIWPVFCSALIVGRLAPLGLHNTRFRSVPLSCSPRTGADASSPRHETRRNVADSGPLGSRKGLRRRTSPVLYAPSAPSAMALPYGSPAVPAGGGMPHSPTPVAYTRPMRRAPWPERCAGPSAPPCEAAHDTACSGARGTGPLVSMAAAHARPAISRASTSAANAVQPKRPRPAPPSPPSFRQRSRPSSHAPYAPHRPSPANTHNGTAHQPTPAHCHHATRSPHR